MWARRASARELSGAGRGVAKLAERSASAAAAGQPSAPSHVQSSMIATT